MTNPMLAELDAVVRLMDAATPGEWYWNEYTANLVTDKPGDGQEFEIAAVYSEHDDDREPANSAAICAAMHFLRTHHATLADMAKRLEAAERDSKRLRNAKTATVEFDETIDGEHVGVIPFPHSAVGRRYKLVCIDATQEGEG